MLAEGDIDIARVGAAIAVFIVAAVVARFRQELEFVFAVALYAAQSNPGAVLLTCNETCSVSVALLFPAVALDVSDFATVSALFAEPASVRAEPRFS